MNKYIRIIRCLRNDSRQTLESISDKTGMPRSTIYDNINAIEKRLRPKHISLIDFKKAGFLYRSITLARPKQRHEFLKMIISDTHTNNIVKLSGEYPLMVEQVFPDINSMITHDEIIRKACRKHMQCNILEQICAERFLCCTP